MSDNSQIDYCDATWNVTAGCTKVSLGCRLCWAIQSSWRMAHNPNPKIANCYTSTVKQVGNVEKFDWTGLVKTLPERLDWPRKWKKPRRIFVCSMSDLFHEQVPYEFINRVWNEAFNVYHHNYIFLTKRPKRLFEWTHIAASAKDWPIEDIWPEWFWLGTTVEDQQRVDERIPHLLKTPAVNRWLSIEPVLGPVDLTLIQDGRTRYNSLEGCGDNPDSMGQTSPNCFGEKLDWVVIGAQTGPGATPPEREWIASIVEQCKAAGVPVFMKNNLANIWGAGLIQQYPEGMVNP